MDGKDRQTERRRAEAAQWFARLKSLPVSHGTLNDFFAWRRQPGNAAAFEETERFWSSADKVGDRPGILRAIEDATSRQSRRTRFRVSARSALWLAASLVLVISIAAGYSFLAPAGQTYATAAGEHRTIALADGSRLSLNGGTEVRVRFTGRKRQLVLGEGQALFNVAKDKARPFTVKAGDVMVTATGTRFDVSRHGERILVTLIEGSVAVRAPDGSVDPLRAGEQWHWPAKAARIQKVKADAVAAWAEARIVFDGAPLADALAEINRHGGAPILLDAAEFRSRRISGSFEVGDAASFAAAVTAFLPLRQTVDGQGRIHLIADQNREEENSAAH
jgi:transmembrane sensor